MALMESELEPVRFFDALVMASRVSNNHGRVIVFDNHVIGIDHGTIVIRIPFVAESHEIRLGIISGVSKETKHFLATNISVEARLDLIKPFRAAGEMPYPHKDSREFAEKVTRTLDELHRRHAFSADMAYEFGLMPKLLRKLGKIDDFPIRFGFVCSEGKPTNESPILFGSKHHYGMVMPIGGIGLMDKPPKAPNKFVFTFLIAESATVTVSANTLNQADKAARKIIPDQHPVIPNTCQLISVIERELYSVQK